MRLKFGQIQPWTAELAALDQFKKSLNLLLENYSKYFDDLLSGERSLPFGLLVDTCMWLSLICDRFSPVAAHIYKYRTYATVNTKCSVCLFLFV